MEISVTVNGTVSTPRRRAAHPARPLHPRARRADRHQHRLRHVVVRRLHAPPQRRGGEELHGARRPGRRRRHHDDRGPGRPTASCTRCSRRSWRTTACSAATARRAWSWPRSSLLNENPNPTEQEVRIGLEGNLCRCTGYHNIVQAVLGRGQGRRREVIPAAFDYVRAGSAEEAISLHRRARRRGQVPRRRPQPAAADEAAPGPAERAGRHRPPHRPVVHPRRRRPHRHRRAHPPHATSRQLRPARRARAAAGPRGQPRRRPAGPPPRHDRRLDRPRRPGLRPAGHDAGARRDVRRPGPERHARDRRRPTSTRASSRRRSPPTSC